MSSDQCAEYGVNNIPDDETMMGRNVAGLSCNTNVFGYIISTRLVTFDYCNHFVSCVYISSKYHRYMICTNFPSFHFISRNKYNLNSMPLLCQNSIKLQCILDNAVVFIMRNNHQYNQLWHISVYKIKSCIPKDTSRSYRSPEIAMNMVVYFANRLVCIFHFMHSGYKIFRCKPWPCIPVNICPQTDRVL